MVKITTEEMVNGNEKNVLLRLSWPIILGMIVQSTFNLVDTFFIGKLGSDALAAMSVTFPMIFMTIALAAGVGIGVNSLISRKLGSNDKKGAGNVAEHGYFLMLVIYIFILIFTFTFMKTAFTKIGATPKILDLVMQYSKTFFVGSFFLFFTFISNNILRAEGDTKTPLMIMIGAGIINMILDPMFIFGFKFIPAMGVQGAALATILSRLVASIFLVYLLFIRENKFKFRYFRFNVSIIKQIMTVGIPAALNQILVSVMLATVNIVLVAYGEIALAAIGIMMRIESFIFMPLSGFLTSVTTMVGQNYGAKRYKRIDKIVKEASKFGLYFIGIVFFTILVGARQIVGIFSNDLSVINLSVSFFYIGIIGYFFLPTMFMINGAMQGMGNGLFPLVSQSIRTIFVAVPLMLLISRVLKLEVHYIIIAFVVSNLFAFIVALFWYYKGPWRKKKFIDSE